MGKVNPWTLFVAYSPRLKAIAKIMKTNLFFLCISFALIACGKKESASVGTGAVPVAPVKMAAIVLNPSNAATDITVTGTVLAAQQVRVQTEIAGKVVKVGFPEGGSVAAGQVLVKLEDSELRARLARAAAQLLLAGGQEKRSRAQFDAGAVSRQEYEQIHAQLEIATADVSLLKAQLDKTEIKAPFAGETGLRQVDLGTVLQPGSAITNLQDLSFCRLEFSVSENQSAGVHVGMPVHFTVTGREDTLEATVFAMEPGLDSETRLLKVRARVESPKGEKRGLRPGAFAKVELPLREIAALWVPSQAVVKSARGALVWKVREGKAELSLFHPGMRTPEAVEVVKGLSAGDTVLITGLMQLKPGMLVQPEIIP